jgi:hypothetical protein
MPLVHHIRFDPLAWRLIRQSPGEQQWHLPGGDSASLTLYEQAPDLPAPLGDVDAMRAFYREIVHQDGGGIVSADVVRLGDHDVVKLVLKFRDTPQSRAIRSIGSIAFLFADCSFVFRVEGVEKGMLGLRESAAFTDFRRSLGRTVAVPMAEWARSPYDPELQSPLPRNKSDDEHWDEQFPDHPLSRVRRNLAHFEKTLELDAAMKDLAPFRSR